MSNKRRCTKCKTDKNPEEFHAGQHICKTCNNAHQRIVRARYVADFEKGIRLTEKRCGKCHVVKPASEFHISPTQKGGLHNRCKTCGMIHQENIIVLRMWQRARNRSKHKQWFFNLTLDDIIIPTVCPILGIPLDKRLGRGRNANIPSIDRIDNTKGYVKGNVRIISERANALKRDATPQEILLLAKDAQRIIATDLLSDL